MRIFSNIFLSGIAARRTQDSTGDSRLKHLYRERCQEKLLLVGMADFTKSKRTTEDTDSTGDAVWVGMCL
jgi:hypothetical protein